MEEKIDMTFEEVKDFTEEELADENVDWKAKAQESLGIAKRRTTQLGKAKAKLEDYESNFIPKSKEEPKPQDKKDSQPTEFDYGQKAFLISNGIKIEEFGLVKNIISATGKSLDDVIVSKYFQAELKELRDAQAVKDALPSDTKRSAPSVKNTVDYWIEKGEYPPDTFENRKLRQDIQAAKEAREKAKVK